MLLPRSNHWEFVGRPQCDKCGCRVRNCSQHRFTTLETISNYRNSYPVGSVVVVHDESHPQMTGTLSYRPEETGGRQREKSLDTRHSDWTTDIAFYRGQKTARWWTVCTTPYKSRFGLSSDSHRILIWREQESRNHPSNIIERDRYGGRGVLVWGGIMLGSRTYLHIFDAGSVNGTRNSNEILLPYVSLFRGAMGLQFLFMGDNAPCHRTVAAKQLLESEDIERMDWPARSPDLNPIEHYFYRLYVTFSNCSTICGGLFWQRIKLFWIPLFGFNHFEPAKTQQLVSEVGFEPTPTFVDQKFEEMEGRIESVENKFEDMESKLEAKIFEKVEEVSISFRSDLEKLKQKVMTGQGDEFKFQAPFSKPSIKLSTYDGKSSWQVYKTQF
ncbi:transposable element Tcb2 transposase [Trichonephila clavipes]|nr:transposable element Tcb2 transposase [Trichonephila clavipes]